MKDILKITAGILLAVLVSAYVYAGYQNVKKAEHEETLHQQFLNLSDGGRTTRTEAEKLWQEMKRFSESDQ